MASKVPKNITNFFSPSRNRLPAGAKASAEKKKLLKKTHKQESRSAENAVSKEEVDKVVVKKWESLIVKDEVVVPELVVPASGEGKIAQDATVPEKVEEKENVVPQVEEVESLKADIPTSLPCLPTEPTTTEPSPKPKPEKKTKKPSKKEKETDDDYTPEKTKKRKGKKEKTKKEAKPDPKQPLITSFIRRSRRVPTDMKRKQELDQLKHYLACPKDEQLEHIVMKQTELKGRGIFAAKKLTKGDFVVEYAGDLMSMEEGKDREAEYQKDSEIGCYIYFFSFKGKRYCIDATAESGRYGRLLNHSKTKANCKTRLVEEPEGIPRLIIEAKVDIEEDAELLYDYGDRSQKALKAHPWLKS